MGGLVPPRRRRRPKATGLPDSDEVVHVWKCPTREKERSGKLWGVEVLRKKSG